MARRGLSVRYFKYFLFAAVFGLLLTAISGCGTGDDSIPAGGIGNLVFRFDVTGKTEVTKQISHYSFRCYDKDGSLLMSKLNVPKVTEYKLMSVPMDTTKIQVNYMAGKQLVGIGMTDVAGKLVSGGDAAVDGPEYVTDDDLYARVVEFRLVPKEATVLLNNTVEILAQADIKLPVVISESGVTEGTYTLDLTDLVEWTPDSEEYLTKVKDTVSTYEAKAVGTTGFTVIWAFQSTKSASSVYSFKATNSIFSTDDPNLGELTNELAIAINGSDSVNGPLPGLAATGMGNLFKAYRMTTRGFLGTEVELGTFTFAADEGSDCDASFAGNVLNATVPGTGVVTFTPENSDYSVATMSVNVCTLGIVASVDGGETWQKFSGTETPLSVKLNSQKSATVLLKMNYYDADGEIVKAYKPASWSEWIYETEGASLSLFEVNDGITSLTINNGSAGEMPVVLYYNENVTGELGGKLLLDF